MKKSYDKACFYIYMIEGSKMYVYDGHVIRKGLDFYAKFKYYMPKWGDYETLYCNMAEGDPYYEADDGMIYGINFWLTERDDAKAKTILCDALRYLAKEDIRKIPEKIQALDVIEER